MILLYSVLFISPIAIAGSRNTMVTSYFRPEVEIWLGIVYAQ